jgi:hypothetical protein
MPWYNVRWTYRDKKSGAVMRCVEQCDTYEQALTLKDLLEGQGHADVTIEERGKGGEGSERQDD